MKQYHYLLEKILREGDWKDASREGMPRTKSIFGHQMRFNLKEGFPIVTTKKVSFKNIVVELLWFMSGDTNIKYLVDNGCNIWNEDAYNYYEKLCKQQNLQRKISYDLFVSYIKNSKSLDELKNDSIANSQKEELHSLIPYDYVLGDCGNQYGALWRKWRTFEHEDNSTFNSGWFETRIDQLKELVDGLKFNPFGRRHIVSAWDPARLRDMALNACHSFVQFNCRPISREERKNFYETVFPDYDKDPSDEDLENRYIPKYRLDCNLTQRSGDSVLGIPYNIASYALMTRIIADLNNMAPGDFIHSIGDAHIYENHIDAAEEQVERDYTKYALPELMLSRDYHTNTFKYYKGLITLDEYISSLKISDFSLKNYQSYPKLENNTSLSTGLIK